jgi:hypothetical protein
MEVCTSHSWITVALIRNASNETVKVFWQFPSRVRTDTATVHFYLIYKKAITDTETS